MTARRTVAVVIAMLCGWVAFAVYSQAVRGHDLDATGRALVDQNAALSQHILDDRNEISQAQDPGWLAEQARKLGYVLPGERVYVLVTPGTTPLPAGGGVDAKLPAYTPASSTPAPSSAPVKTPPPTPYAFVVPAPSPH